MRVFTLYTYCQESALTQIHTVIELSGLKDETEILSAGKQIVLKSENGHIPTSWKDYIRMTLNNLLFGHQAVLFVFAGCWQLDSFFNASSCVIWVREQVNDKAFMNYAETWVCLSAASGVESMAVKDWLSPWSHQAELGSGAGIVGHVVDAQDLMISGTCYEFPSSAVVPVRSVFGYCLCFLVLLPRANRFWIT